MSFGHDEYLYQVLKHHKVSVLALRGAVDARRQAIGAVQGCRLPPEALYMIRYHSFYPWHTKGDYAHLASQYDHAMLEQIHLFKYSTLPRCIFRCCFLTRATLQRVRSVLEGGHAARHRHTEALLSTIDRRVCSRQNQVLKRLLARSSTHEPCH